MDILIQAAPYLLIILVFYFLIIRPQSKKRKDEKKFAENLKVGDRIITTSGMHAKVNSLPEGKSTMVVETSAGKLTFERSAISMELTKQLHDAKN